MKTLVKLASENGFGSTNVSTEEYEDGIGAVVGLNFTKDGIFYTPAQMLSELGHEMKFSSGKLKARNAADAKNQVIAQMKSDKVIAGEITKCNEYARGMFFVNVNYVK